MLRYLTICLMMSIGFTALFPLRLASQEFEKSSYEDFIVDAMSASHVPGLAVILFDENGVTYEGAFGIADQEKTPVTLETPFQLASVSKSFTALVVVQLAAEGRLKLDDPIIKYLPYFRTLDNEAWQNVTIRHVLSHRSGVTTLDGNRLHDDSYSEADALQTAVKGLRKAKLTSIPGQRFEYSNANYMIAGALIESVTGQSFETAVRERIFKPLGMTDSFVHRPDRDGFKKAVGFRQWFGWPVAFPSTANRAWVAAGGITASARDLAKYVQAIANQDPRIVPSEFAKDIISPQGNDLNPQFGYGLGWMLDGQTEKTFVNHSGLSVGYASQAGFFPGDKRGGIVLTNLSGSLKADVPNVVLRKGLDLPTGRTTPSMGQYMLVWGMVANVVGLLFLAGLSMVRFSRYVKKNGGVNEFRRAALSLWLFTIAFIIGVFVPKMNGLTLDGMRQYTPDVWLCLVLSILVLVVWGLTRLIYPRRIP